jgi:hypothetical protein
MVDHFDGYVKRIFADKEDSVRIKFGTLRDNDPARDISGGQLRLSGFVMFFLFAPHMFEDLLEAK